MDMTITIDGNPYIIEVDTSTAGIAGGFKNNVCKGPPQSFQIHRVQGPTKTEYSLTINKHRYVGRYNTQAKAMGVLYGLHIAHGGNPLKFPKWISRQATNNATVIPELTAASGGSPFTIHSEGWNSYLTLDGTITGGADPGFNYSNNSISISRPGYTSAGAATTKTISSAMTNTVRKADPNENDSDTVDNGDSTYTTRVACSKYIYSTDTVTGSMSSGFDTSITSTELLDVTNNSTLAAPPVIANWAVPVVDYVHDNNLTVDLAAFHMSASSGDHGIACVIFKLYKNGSSTASETVTVTSTTNRQNSTTGLYYAVFTNTFDITADIDGTSYRVSADIYPVWGPSKSSQNNAPGSTGLAMYTEVLSDLYYWKDAGFNVPTYYCNGTTGNDANAGTSGAPFKTIEAGIAALVSDDGNNCSSGIVRLSGNFAGFSPDSQITIGTQDKPLKIMADTGQTVTIQGGALNSNDQYCTSNSHVIIEGLDFDFSSAVSSGVGDGTTGGFYILWGTNNVSSSNPPTRYTLKNCTFDSGTNTGSNDFNFMYCTLDMFDVVVDNDSAEAFLYHNDNITSLNIRGGLTVGTRAYHEQQNQSVCMIASKWHGPTKPQLTNSSDWATSSYSGRSNDNRIIAWNQLYEETSGTNTLQKNEGDDFALVCNWIEASTGTSVSACCYLFADGNDQNTDNNLIWQNSTCGQRTNMYYNDANYGLLTNIQVKGNLFASAFIKSDYFANNGTLTGNWGPMNQVDFAGNAVPAFTDSSGLNTASFPFDHNVTKWYADNDNDPLVYLMYPADGSRSVGDLPIPLDSDWATNVGWTWSSTDAPIAVDLTGTAIGAVGCETETILDTYTLAGGNWAWSATNTWWNGFAGGTWDSTGTATGTYLAVDSGSRLDNDFMMFSSSDPGGWPTNARIRICVTPSTGGTPHAIYAEDTRQGDSKWNWKDSEGNDVSLATADFEAGGNWGWDTTDSVKIQIYTP